MPLTPYHLGPGFLLGLLFFKWLDVVAVLVGSVILDLEPLILLVTGVALPLHGIFHTHVAAGLISVPTSVLLWYLHRLTRGTTRFFCLEQNFGPRRIYTSCLVGTISHVFLDSFLYIEMNPFYPILGNPFYGYLASSLVYDSCMYAGIAGLVIYFVLLLTRATAAHRGKDQKPVRNEVT